MCVVTHDEAERYNALSRFFFDFRDLAESAGHVVITETLSSSVESTLMDDVTVTVSVKAQRLVAAPDVTTEEQLEELRGRIYKNQASEDDKWTYYRHSYKQGWGIDIVTTEFVEENGTQALAHLVDPQKGHMRVAFLGVVMRAAFGAQEGRRELRPQ